MKYILIVEDDVYLKFIYKKALSDSLDVNVKIAKTWREGKVFLLHQIFDLVILDIKLPDVNGIDALREIRQLKEEQKVIMASSYGSKENIMELARLKASGFLLKPFSMEMLIEKIKQVLEI